VQQACSRPVVTLLLALRACFSAVNLDVRSCQIRHALLSFFPMQMGRIDQYSTACCSAFCLLDRIFSVRFFRIQPDQESAETSSNWLLPQFSSSRYSSRIRSFSARSTSAFSSFEPGSRDQRSFPLFDFGFCPSSLSRSLPLRGLELIQCKLGRFAC